ncbi:hypothetical protein D3C87_1802200 [compost metagenome]
MFFFFNKIIQNLRNGHAFRDAGNRGDKLANFFSMLIVRKRFMNFITISHAYDIIETSLIDGNPRKTQWTVFGKDFFDSFILFKSKEDRPWSHNI